MPPPSPLRVQSSIDHEILNGLNVARVLQRVAQHRSIGVAQRLPAHLLEGLDLLFRLAGVHGPGELSYGGEVIERGAQLGAAQPGGQMRDLQRVRFRVLRLFHPVRLQDVGVERIATLCRLIANPLDVVAL